MMKILALPLTKARFFVFIILAAFLPSALHAQYYYNDIVCARQAQEAYSALLTGRVNLVTATCFDENNEQNPDFIYRRSIAQNGSRVETILHLPSSDTIYTTNIYADKMLQSATDSNGTVITKTSYRYNSDGSIAAIQIETNDNAAEMHNEEVHLWFYTGGKPEKMLRIKDKTDTTVVSFIQDEYGNPGEEIWRKRNRIIEHYYYYCNNSNQLTDIVRYNEIARQLLPDFLFEYSPSGTVATLTQVPQGSSDYIVWRYEYNSAGLKTSDVLYNKQKEIIGRIIYSYQ